MSEDRDESAKRFRDAAEARLGGRRVEAAGVFQREVIDELDLLYALIRIYERLTKGRAGRLPGRFILAVTDDEVHAFKYSAWPSKNPVGTQLAVFGRKQIRLRRTPGRQSTVIYLHANEGGKTREIVLEGDVVEKSPGAAEVLAALAE